MDWLPRKVSTGLSLQDTSYGVSSVATKRWRDRCEREWFLRLDGGTDYAVDESYSHGVQGFYASSPHSPSIRTKDCFVSWITSCLHSRQRDLGSKRTTTEFHRGEPNLQRKPHFILKSYNLELKPLLFYSEEIWAKDQVQLITFSRVFQATNKKKREKKLSFNINKQPSAQKKTVPYGINKSNH